MSSPSEVTLELRPESRVDVIEVTERIEEQHPGFFKEFDKSVFFSYHTTAGYFEQAFCNRLGHDRDTLEAYLGSFRHLFPEDAGYRHDEMSLRDELTEEQKLVEPKNADSHLTFIGSGLENCVTYANREHNPVYFVDLDGVNGSDRRRRRTTVLGINREEHVDRFTLEIPVSSHPVDSINLWDPALGLLDRLQELVSVHGVSRGRIDIALDASERQTGLTINEYETLLMRHDLAEVLENPIRFMAQKGRNMLRDPRAIADKAKDYAKYDLVHVANAFVDALGLSETVVERVIDKFLSVPASRFLRMKRKVSMVVNAPTADASPQIITGTYQSPILVQWAKNRRQSRKVDVTYTRFV